MTTVNTLIKKNVPPDRAVMLAAVKAMQYSLTSMELSFTAKNVVADGHTDAEKTAQNEHRELLKNQIDEILSLFDVPKPTEEQAFDANHVPPPLQRAHSARRVKPDPSAKAKPEPAANSGAALFDRSRAVARLTA